jgi:hypothetical protein
MGSALVLPSTGVCLFGALEVARRSSARATSHCRVALWLLAAAAVAVRFALYDPHQASEVQMGRLLHFDHSVAPSVHTRDWLFRTFGASATAAVTRMGQRSTAGDYSAHSAAAAAFVSLWSQLYAAVHMRYGAMVMGALLAFYLPAEGDPSQPTGRRARSFFSQSSPLLGMQAGCEAAVRWGLLLCAAVPFVLGMSTDLDGLGAIWSLEITVFLRSWAALATCVLLFCAMAPAASVWRVDWLAAALSWRGWKPIADISYGALPTQPLPCALAHPHPRCVVVQSPLCIATPAMLRRAERMQRTPWAQGSTWCTRESSWRWRCAFSRRRRAPHPSRPHTYWGCWRSPSRWPPSWRPRSRRWSNPFAAA